MEESISKFIRKQQLQRQLSPISHELQSEIFREEQQERKIFDYWTHEIKSYGAGYRMGIQFLREHPDVFEEFRNSENNVKVSLEDCIVKDTDIEIFNNPQKLSEVLLGTSTFQELCNKPAQVLFAFYTAGKSLFEEKKFIDAHHVFSFLTLMNQGIPCFWVGRGSANESLQNWNEALDDYWMAQSLNPEDIFIYQGIIRIYQHLHDEKSLKHCFEIMEHYPTLLAG